MQKRKWLTVLGILLFLSLGTAWLMGAFSGDTVMVNIQKQIDDNAGKDLTWEQRREQFRSIREQVKDLPKDKQDQLMHQAGRKFFMRGMEERIDKFLALPPDQRIAELDKEIRQEEDMKRRWEERRQRAEANSASGNSGDSKDQSKNGGAGQSTAADQNGGGRGAWRNMDRETRMRSMLDHTTPQQRAKWGEYRMAMEQRRKELGLPAGGRGPWGGGGWRPR